MAGQRDILWHLSWIFSTTHVYCLRTDVWTIRLPGLQDGRLQRSTGPSSLPTPVRLMRKRVTSWQPWRKAAASKSSVSVFILRLGKLQPLCASSIRKASGCNDLLATKLLCWHCSQLASFKTLKRFSRLQVSQASAVHTILLILRLETQKPWD